MAPTYAPAAALISKRRRELVRFGFGAALGAILAIAIPGVAAAGQFSSLFPNPANLPPSAAVQPLANPPEYRSRNGVLDVTFEARETRVKLGRFEINGATYDGIYAGPVLRVNPGDVLHVHLINRLPQITNIHFHGLAVSPLGHGDDSLHMVAPGTSWDYVIPIPKDHPPGVYWFHTHGHDFAERQLMGGLSGTLVIEGFQQQMPATEPLKERLFVLKEFSPNRNGDLNKVPKPYNVVVKTINGQLMPRIDIKPGETQLWRLSDQTADTYFRLALEGHSFTIIGRDSRPLPHPEIAREVMFGPAERIDVLVTGGKPGAYRLIAEKTSTGPAGDMFGSQNMALMVSARDPAAPTPVLLGPLTVVSGAGRPIPGDRIDARRLVSFSEDPLVTGLFFINHQTFDPERVDFKVPLGSIEEWTIRNASDELHVFHIHQLPFQVISVNGKPQPFDGLLDTVNVPIHGEVKIRLAFTDPIIVGRFLFHCHILEHEDKGMMGQIEVYDPKAGPMPAMAMAMGGMNHGTGGAHGDPMPAALPAATAEPAPRAMLVRAAAPAPLSPSVLINKPTGTAAGAKPGTAMAMGVGGWPKFSLATIAVAEFAAMNAKSGPDRGPSLGLRVDSTMLLEVNDALSIDGLLQWKPRKPRPPTDPNQFLYINQDAGRAEGGKMKELYVRYGNYRFGKFVQNFGRAYFFLPGPFARDFIEEAEQGYEPADMIGAEALHLFKSESGGWRQLTVSAFMVDRTFLHESWPYNEGMIHYVDGGVGNTHLPENIMVAFDNLNMPLGHWGHLTWQAAAIRWGRTYRAQRGEFWTTLGGDLAIPLGGSVDDTLSRRYSQLRLYVEGAHRANFQGFAGRSRTFLSGSAEYLLGPWIFDLTTSQRWTRDRLLPLQKDEFYSASLGYVLPSQAIASISITHEKVGPRRAFYSGITLTQTLTACSRCLNRGRAY
jgi:FtsP/CotA-like multicopper oxidase with cupredoxin domain